MHISSLPSPYGIGTLGKAARDFVDFLEAAGQTFWQTLPICPTSYGDSPYQSCSTYAGNPYFIDLDLLREEGLLEKEDYEGISWEIRTDQVDYGILYRERFDVLGKAARRFRHRIRESGHTGDGISTLKEAYETFCRENGFWLDDFALFMTIKNLNGGKAWTEWDSALRNREKEALELVRARQEGEIAFWKILQFFFFRQWKALHNYCAGKNIRIIGDMPFYVALDSVDVWARPDLFLLDEERIPIEVAGVPPDGFSETGQLWGNPVYRWEEHKKTGYSWWIQKIGYLCREYDILRIDHFRGFDSYYTVKYGSEDARGGTWRPGPGYALFEALKKSRGDLPIIAEDLGYTTESVRKLLKDTGFPGMKILQFGFDERDEGSSDHLPHQYPVHCVAYTGTHDNDTLCGWLEHADPGDVACARDYLRLEGAKEPHWDMIKALYATAAETVIVQTQDLLGLDSESRMNTPSTMGGNWCWRLCQGDLNKELAEKLRHITSLYDRMNLS